MGAPHHRKDRTYIYQIYNRINGKKYIGITSYPPNKRWSSHKSAARTSNGKSAIAAAIRKYGSENFDFSPFGVIYDRAEACRMEKYFIAKLRPEYNQTSGGDGGWNLSEESKKKMSVAATGRIGFWKGKKKGWGPWEGKRRSAKTIEKLRLAQTGKKRDDNIKNKCLLTRNSRKGTKIISVLCLEDNILHSSLTKAAIFYNINRHAISDVCNKKISSVHGKTFSWYDENVIKKRG